MASLDVRRAKDTAAELHAAAAEVVSRDVTSSPRGVNAQTVTGWQWLGGGAVGDGINLFPSPRRMSAEIASPSPSCGTPRASEPIDGVLVAFTKVVPPVGIGGTPPVFAGVRGLATPGCAPLPGHNRAGCRVGSCSRTQARMVGDTAPRAPRVAPAPQLLGIATKASHIAQRS